MYGMYTEEAATSDRNFIAQQIAQALTYMHTLSAPMIHRDIKPSNVLLRVVCYSLGTITIIVYITGRKRYTSCVLD